MRAVPGLGPQRTLQPALQSGAIARFLEQPRQRPAVELVLGREQRGVVFQGEGIMRTRGWTGITAMAIFAAFAAGNFPTEHRTESMFVRFTHGFTIGARDRAALTSPIPLLFEDRSPSLREEAAACHCRIRGLPGGS